MSAIIQCHNISKHVVKDGMRQVILPQTSLDVKQGSLLAITGSSGSGKSTLLNILGLLDQCSHGSYYLQGKDCSALTPQDMANLRQQSFGYIFQQYWLIKQLTVLENIQLPLYYANISMQKSREKCLEIMEMLDIAAYANRYPHQLSGGQQQRVSIARAISTKPPILLADEPTGALDTENTKKILQILRSLNEKQKTTILIVTHDNWVADQCNSRINLSELFTKPYLLSHTTKKPEPVAC